MRTVPTFAALPFDSARAAPFTLLGVLLVLLIFVACPRVGFFGFRKFSGRLLPWLSSTAGGFDSPRITEKDLLHHLPHRELSSHRFAAQCLADIGRQVQIIEYVRFHLE